MGAFYSQRVKAQVLGGLILLLAVVAAGIVIVPHADTTDTGAVVVLAPISAVIGIALLIVSRTREFVDSQLYAGLALSLLLLTGTNHVLGPAALVALSYTWFALYVFAFFPRRVALAYLALEGLSFLLVLTGQDVTSPVVRWILGIGTPLVAGLLLSLTLRLAAQRNATLEESERRTATILEAAPNAFFAIDTEGTVLQWNLEAERMFGWSAKEAIGRNVADVVVLPGDQKAHAQRRRDVFEKRSPGEPPVRIERELMRRDGTEFFSETVQTLVETEDGLILLVFVRDLTERLEREAEREQLIQEQSAREEAEHLATMVQGLQELLDAALAYGRLEQMLEALLPKLTEVLNADEATIYLADEDGRLVRRGGTRAVKGSRVVEVGERLAGRVAEAGEALLENDPPAEDVEGTEMEGMSSMLGVPLTATGTVTGVIQVGVRAPRTFDGDDLLLLGLAADRVALAVDHAQLFEREHRIAETLQRSLLPERLPALPGMEVAARYIPAKAEAEVGGDWYDVLQLDSSRVGLVMGDVAGKGLAAASLVGRMRAAMRAYALDDHEPAAVITRLNQLIWSEIDDSDMATLVYAVIDPARAQISWVSAGHPPPLILDGDGNPSYLEGPRSVPLGVMPFPSYHQGTATLEGDTTLLFYTDGLVERPGEILDRGFERLAAAGAAAERGAEELCDHVLSELVSAGQMADDVALLALHQPLLSESFSLELPSDGAELASMRALLRRWLHHAGASEAEVAEILAAIGEAAANAIEHSGQFGAGLLRVAGEVADRAVTITVRDEGRWREPEPSEKRGRGLILMRELMDGVDVDTTPDGTTVVLRRTLRDHEPAL